MQFKLGLNKVWKLYLSLLLSFEVFFQTFCVLTKFLNLDKNHGVILLPEGLIESIPEVYALLQVNCK